MKIKIIEINMDKIYCHAVKEQGKSNSVKLCFYAVYIALLRENCNGYANVQTEGVPFPSYVLKTLIFPLHGKQDNHVYVSYHTKMLDLGSFGSRAIKVLKIAKLSTIYAKTVNFIIL